MSSLQVGMRRYACVDPHWLCVDKWLVSYSDMHIAYCLLPVLLRMDALGYHSMGLGRFPQSGSIPGVWVDSMGLGGFPVYGPIPLPIHKSSGITTVHICRVHIGHGLT